MDRGIHRDGQPLLLLLRRPRLRSVLPEVLHLLSPTTPSSASTATSTSSGSSPREESPSRPSTTASGPAPTPSGCSVCDGLSAAKIDALLRKWLRPPAAPVSAADRKAGYRYDVSILQAEFSLTQVLDRPQTGRVFFEEVIRENLDIGRPDQVQLIFDRRVNRRTPGRFRTRVLTDGVIPSLHVDYKRTRIKQYHKEGRHFVPRPPSTTRATSASANASKILENCARSALRPTDVCSTSNASVTIASSAKPPSRTCKNLHGERPTCGGAAFRRSARAGSFTRSAAIPSRPGHIHQQGCTRASCSTAGKKPSQLSPGQITYDLRRLRLHGLTERIPKTHRYRITAKGLRTAIFYTGLYTRSLRTGLAIISPSAANPELPIAKSIRAAETAVNKWYQHETMAA